MSKCWYCNNELTTGDNPKHFGICNKCYDKMFKSGDTIIRSFINKISDLEAKLAESEKKNFELIAKLNLKEYAPAFCTLADRDCEALGQIEKLKQQLAEKERQVKKLNNEAQKYFEDAYCNDSIYQDKISFCIEKFQETKKSLRDKVCLMGNDTHYYLQNAIHWQDVVAIIDNQIEELKKGVE